MSGEPEDFRNMFEENESEELKRISWNREKGSPDVFYCVDCAGGPCRMVTQYPFREEKDFPVQCPFDEHGVSQAKWMLVENKDRANLTHNNETTK